MKKFLHPLTLFCSLVILIPSCGLTGSDDDEIFLGHSIEVHNQSSSDIFLRYSVLNKVIDTTSNNKNIERVRLDSSYKLASGSLGPLIKDYSLRSSRNPYSVNQIKIKILDLKIYKLVNTDTLWAEVDLLDSANWNYYNNDPIAFGKTIHIYRLEIDNEHFD